MPTATQSEIEGLNVTVNTTRGEDELNNGDIVYEGEFIKYSVQITNTTGSDINNVKIQASIPDGLTYGELEADYYSYNGKYEYNFENDTREKEINVGTVKSGQTITKFYEVKVNDLADNENEKQVTSNIKMDELLEKSNITFERLIWVSTSFTDIPTMLGTRVCS